MNHAQRLTAITLASAVLAGCASSGTTADKTPATQATYVAALADATLSIKKASKAHYEWRDTGKMLKKSEEAAKKGDFDTATKIALKAKRQGELALVQSKDQANAGPRL